MMEQNKMITTLFIQPRQQIVTAKRYIFSLTAGLWQGVRVILSFLGYGYGFKGSQRLGNSNKQRDHNMD